MAANRTARPLRALIPLLALGLLLGAGIANARTLFLSPEDDEVVVAECTDDGTDDGSEVVLTSDDGTTDDGTTDEGDDECVEPVVEDEGDEGDVEDGVVDEPSGDRESDCREAAEVEGDEYDLDDDGDVQGLENAMERLLENCRKNEQAPGLLVALGRIRDNFDRHAEHDAQKAERAAAREEAKAARHGDDSPGGNPHWDDHPGNGNGYGHA